MTVHRLLIFLDGFQDPIIINGVEKFTHSNNVIKFEYKSNDTGYIRKGLFFTDKVTGFILNDATTDK